VPHDDAAAARWCQEAARQGELAAQTRLGLMYRDGRGVPQDQALAYAWLSLAAEATSDTAETDESAQARAELVGRLSEAELAAGRAQIDALRRLGAAAP
jgi:TPR repeat protein